MNHQSANRPAKNSAFGVLWGMGAVLIWASWWAATRHGVLHGLDATDLTVLRFGVSGAILLPVFLKAWDIIRKVRPWMLLLLTAGAGAPYTLAVGTGLGAVTAGNGGAIVPGMIPVAVAVLCYLQDRRLPAGQQWTGMIIIVAGTALIAFAGGFAGENAWSGFLLLVLGSILWACFTIAARASRLSPLEATAVVSVTSGAFMLPLFLANADSGLTAGGQHQQIIWQAIFQGIVTGIAAVLFYSRAVMSLGATKAAVMIALIPVFATIIGAVFLHEIPSELELFGIALLSAGVAIVSLAGRNRHEQP